MLPKGNAKSAKTSLLVVDCLCCAVFLMCYCVCVLCDLVLAVMFVSLCCSVCAACLMCCWVLVVVMVYAVLFYCGAFVLFSYVWGRVLLCLFL